MITCTAAIAVVFFLTFSFYFCLADLKMSCFIEFALKIVAFNPLFFDVYPRGCVAHLKAKFADFYKKMASSGRL